MTRAPRLDSVCRLLDQACASGHPPAASCVVYVRGRIRHLSAHGVDPSGSPVTPESVFDVASVTKVLATTTAVARLVSGGELSLDRAVRDVLPEFPHPSTVRELLGHRSGLEPWRPFFTRVMRDPVAGVLFPGPASAGPASAGPALREALDVARARVLEGVFETPLGTPGRRRYSDLGFMTLGALVERVAGQTLDGFVAAQFAGRALGYRNFRVADSWLDGRHVVPTGRTRPREPAAGQEALFSVPEQAPRLDPGCVDDDNAYALGGVAGHAGVFGTAKAVARFGMDLIETLDGSTALGVTPEVLRELGRLDPADGPARALGFDVPTGPKSTAGGLGEGPRGALGHLGFTGCSLWMDLDRQASVALLTNRTLPGRSHVAGIRALRPAVHVAVREALDGGTD